MPAEEFDELVRDIKRNGLITTITAAEDGTILDGWHRYRACIKASVKPRVEPFSYMVEPANEDVGHKMTEAEYACAQNAHRRHLTSAKKREIVAALLKVEPAKSDRAIGGMAKVDHKTVAAVRSQAEGSGEIPQLTKTTGKDGRARTKPAKPKKSGQAISLPTAEEDHPAVDASAQAPTIDDAPAGHSESASGLAQTASKRQRIDAAPDAMPRGKGCVPAVDLADRQRTVAVLKACGEAVQSAAEDLDRGTVKRTRIEQTIKKLEAAIAELEQLRASAEVQQ
jgi:site-specific DNA-methyltransferase (adenine-specific)